MKFYGVKPEYLDLWDADADTVLAADDVEMIVRGWGKTVDEVADQIYELPVIFTGYDPDDNQVGIILDGDKLYVTDFLTKLYKVNEKSYRKDDVWPLSLAASLLIGEGWQLDWAWAN